MHSDADSAPCSPSPGYQDIAKHLRALQRTLVDLCDNSGTDLTKNFELEMEQSPVTNSQTPTAENEVQSDFQTRGDETQTEPVSDACVIS